MRWKSVETNCADYRDKNACVTFLNLVLSAPMNMKKLIQQQPRHLTEGTPASCISRCKPELSLFNCVCRKRGACMYPYMRVCVCMYVCMYVCMDGWMDGWMHACKVYMSNFAGRTA